MEESEQTELLLARWSHRFVAWLIDFIIISIISGAIISASVGPVNVELESDMFWATSTNYIPTSLIFFGYWIILEYKTGQTIGKKILNLKTAGMDGKRPELIGIVLGSFGKSFLLPIDVVLGWIFTNDKRQRIFNRLGNTIVIKLSDTNVEFENISYKKD